MTRGPSVPPHRWSFTLTEEQRHELGARLRKIVQPGMIDSAIYAIDFAAGFAERSDPSWSRRNAAATHKHMAAVAEAASRLLSLLRLERSDGQDSRPLVRTAVIDWPSFERTLGRVAAAAREEARSVEPVKGAGRPHDHWRDVLVRIVASIYPPGAPRGARSHLTGTVALVLRWIGRPVRDAKDVVRDGLCRCPEPPYIVTPTRR